MTPAPTGSKRGARAADPAAQAGDKPTRGRSRSRATKRRTKKVIAEQQQQAAQVSQDITGAAVSPPETPASNSSRCESQTQRNASRARAMQAMDIQTSIEQDVVHVPAFQDAERSNGLSGFPGSSNAPQITSYWSCRSNRSSQILLHISEETFMPLPIS